MIDNVLMCTFTITIAKVSTNVKSQLYIIIVQELIKYRKYIIFNNYCYHHFGATLLYTILSIFKIFKNCLSNNIYSYLFISTTVIIVL